MNNAILNGTIERMPLWRAPGHCPWRCAHSFWTEYKDRNGQRRLLLKCNLSGKACDFHREPYGDCDCEQRDLQ